MSARNSLLMSYFLSLSKPNRKSGDQPTIKSPEKYAGRTLERHLQLYDWKNEYDTFDRIIKTSNFDGICNSAVVSSRVSRVHIKRLMLHA